MTNNKQLNKKGGLSREAGFQETLSMGNISSYVRAIDDWLLSWAKRIGIWTLRGLEVIASGIGAIVMLVVIGIFALFDYVFG